jgi:hypothetical protein
MTGIKSDKSKYGDVLPLADAMIVPQRGNSGLVRCPVTGNSHFETFRLKAGAPKDTLLQVLEEAIRALALQRTGN